MKAALYLRVSTDEQSAENQRPECEQLARARGWEIDQANVYVETVSGAARERPAFDAMRESARRGAFGALVVWSIDRLGRNLDRIVSTVRELDRVGVQVVSVRESWLDTSGPARDLLLYVFAWVAEHERRTLRERTRAGLERARREGVKLGRPKGAKDRQPRKRRTKKGSAGEAP